MCLHTVHEISIAVQGIRHTTHRPYFNLLTTSKSWHYGHYVCVKVDFQNTVRQEQVVGRSRIQHASQFLRSLGKGSRLLDLYMVLTMVYNT
jgi:hypothetical protein